jgi:ankyrin repeat protein
MNNKMKKSVICICLVVLLGLVSVSAKRVDVATLANGNPRLNEFSSVAFRHMVSCNNVSDLNLMISILSTDMDLNEVDEHGNTLLMSCIRSGACTNMIGLLLDFGADINKANDEGVNAFLLACQMAPDLAIPYMLFRLGADCTAVNVHGESALDLARSNPALTGGVIVILIEQRLAGRI